jgi:hypothetical protein
VKSSTLYWGRNAPLVTLLKRSVATASSATPRWSAKISTDPVFGRLYVGDIFVAHLAPTADLRVPRGRRAWPPPARSCAGPASRRSRTTPRSSGYPYPLARAHQAARDHWVRRGGHPPRLPGGAVARDGMAEDDVELLFQDFHEVLNR